MRNAGIAKRGTPAKTQKSKRRDPGDRIPVSDIEGALRREIHQRRIAEAVAHQQADAIARTLELLVREPALPDFMRAMLRTINRQCGGIWSTLWLVDERTGGGVRKWTQWRDEEIGEKVEAFASRHTGLMHRLSLIYRESLSDAEATMVVPAEDPRVPLHIRHFYRRIGARATVLVALTVGKELLGWLSHQCADSGPGPERTAFMECMAKQAALAIHITRFAEIEGEAECAREGEQRAREQEREMVAINRLLRINAHESGDRIDAVLRGVLDHTAALLNGSWASLWRVSDAVGFAQPVWIRDDGECTSVEPEESQRLAADCSIAHRSRMVRWLSSEEISEEAANGKRLARFLTTIGAPGEAPKGTRLASVPLMFDGESQGFILVLTDDLPDRSSERWMAAKALGMQGALALSLDNLSSIQRAAALAEERNRIARDLHDLLAQSFAGIVLQVEAMQAGCPELPDAVTVRLEKIRGQAARSAEELRRTLQMLRPTALDEGALAEALAALARTTESQSGVSVRFKNRAQALQFAPRVEQHLFAIVSEALQNALSHASPRRISITMTIVRKRLILRVSNDGRIATGEPKTGFDGRRHGLSNIHDRASEIGATFTLRTRHQHTQLEMLVPLERLAAAL